MVFFFITIWISIYPVRATPLIADLSNYHIAIDSSFNGTRIFLFGARVGNGDIVVAIRGENRNYIIRKKEEIAGVWVNRKKMKFYHVPNFYSIASSKPLSEINKSVIFEQLGIGDNNIIPASESRLKNPYFQEFKKAFLEYQKKRKVYTAQDDKIGFMGETLFKTVINFSDNIPPGKYTAEIYLLRDGKVIGMQSTPIKVEKSGLDAFIYNFAHLSPALYGIVSIIIALGAGWLAGRVFERRS